ncbi:MAG: hypothetical protein H6642_16800 [Caldilineaceae bacterium]|nr:hypothetical protein [Caldilineaceae bacterium]
MTADPASALAALAQRFVASFPAASVLPRTVGREAEFPIVTATGAAADLRRLWGDLLTYDDMTPVFGASARHRDEFIVGLDSPDFSYALEVGVGTVEVTTRPCRDLLEIEVIMQEAAARLVRAAARHGWRLLGYGIQPLTPPSLAIMAPKQRYFSLYRAMGESWLWYTVTASDQVQVSVSRAEMIDQLNFMNLMTPVIIGLCANSPIYAGEVSPFCSAREGRMAEIYTTEHRHGMLPRPMAHAADFIATLAESTYLIVRDEQEIYPSSEPFSAYLARNGPDYDAFLFHDHYIWNSARLRAQYGTIEIRPACQQPWNEHMAASALGLGLVEGMARIAPMVEAQLGPACWTIMEEYHRQVTRYGLRAGEPVPGFLTAVLDGVETALFERGFGEERLLAPLRRRLERRLNPAQEARRVFRSDGMAGLLRHAAVYHSNTRVPLAK